jgi:hypothetical protein
MADNISCKHCGYCESAHILEEDNERMNGYEVTLSECKTREGFYPENLELAKRLARKAEEEAYAQAMRHLPKD